MRKKFLSLLILASFSFSLLPSVFAESLSTPIAPISVKSIVPLKYFMKYKGEFHTYDQVYASFKQKHRPMTNEEQTKSKYGINIQTPDELAALLSYMNDQKELLQSQVRTFQVDKKSRNRRSTSRIITSKWEETIYDNYLYWIKGYVTIDYSLDLRRITYTTARSALLGVTFGHAWYPESPRITALSDHERQVIFAGTITTSVFVSGVLEVLSHNVDYTMTVVTQC